MSSPITIALAGAERSTFGEGPPAVPSRISRDFDFARVRLGADDVSACALPVASAASEMPAACSRRRRERLISEREKGITAMAWAPRSVESRNLPRVIPDAAEPRSGQIHLERI